MNNVESEDKFPVSLTNGLTKTMFSKEAQEQYFAVLVMRWFHFNNYSTEKYKNLIYGKHVEKEIYHKFLNENPFLLEAFHSKMWSKPRFGELFQPDFVIKAIDNNYTIIEIEKPYQQIITKNRNLSSTFENLIKHGFQQESILASEMFILGWAFLPITNCIFNNLHSKR